MYLETFRLDGRTAVVTGGASGIGVACVDALLAAGATVVIADHSEANLADARTRLHTAAAHFEHLDVRDAAAVNALAGRLGAVDILVTGAGIGRQTAGEDITDAEWREMMAVNLDGVF